ncbi:DUF3311 domain-containing protein [Gluconacetobacter azotocaptans]|uniref:DUF3311 domain-containing protein n=1 Tax=Gluconacetobacter azotocaptans TaxID=142834 RepID=A0A7W4PDW9_9PROT|nr:DUF3311 domain-containing protein [Gluconacetobacter azotocaptans]
MRTDGVEKENGGAGLREPAAGQGWRVAVGLGVPFCAIVLAIPFLGGTRMTVAAFPLPVFWMFCCFILASLCMAIVWTLSDRRRGDDG